MIVGVTRSPERWLSGRKHRFAKSAYGFTRTTSSNLVLSASKLRTPPDCWEFSAFFMPHRVGYGTLVGRHSQAVLASHLHSRKDQVSADERERLIALIKQAQQEGR